eukprot:2088709-Pyramimonas_sp.AAC.1
MKVVNTGCMLGDSPSPHTATSQAGIGQEEVKVEYSGLFTMYNGICIPVSLLFSSTPLIVQMWNEESVPRVVLTGPAKYIGLSFIASLVKSRLSVCGPLATRTLSPASGSEPAMITISSSRKRHSWWT